MKSIIVFFVFLFSPLTIAEANLKIFCSAKANSCLWLKERMYELHGIKSEMIVKSSGEVLNIIETGAETFDIWWGGTGDTHLKAAESGFLAPITLKRKQDQLFWSRHLLDISKGRSVGVYAGILGIIVNKKVLSDLKLDVPLCWSDLGKTTYKNQIVLGDPNTSGTAYTFLSTLFQIYNGEKIRQILPEIKQNIRKTTNSGYQAILPLIEGENAISIAFIHDVISLLDKYEDLDVIIPCEGTGYEIGAASVINSSKNKERAINFIELSMQPDIQNLLSSDIGLQIYSNINTVKSGAYNDEKYFNLINYDFFTYSRPMVRKRTLEFWNRLD